MKFSALGLVVAAVLLPHPALAGSVPTYGVCYVEYWDSHAAEYGGTGFVTGVFTILEDDQDSIFGPEGRYTAEDVQIRPHDMTTNVDQVRANLHGGKGWKADDISGQFYAYLGDSTRHALRNYTCLQFLTLESANGFVVRRAFDPSRLRDWHPAGTHVVAKKAAAKPPKGKSASASKPPAKDRAKPKPTTTTPGALTVEKVKPTVDPAWDDAVRKTLAAEAQRKVEAAVKAAQADAQKQAEIEKFFAERRRQGRAQ